MIKTFFWTLIGFFIIAMTQFLVPDFSNFLRLYGLFMVPLIIFSLLGIPLIIFTVREKAKGLHKIFLLLTGASTVGFMLFVVLHNVFYAIGMLTISTPILNQLMEILHVTFFILAIPICPIVFAVGAIGTITMEIRKLSNSKNIRKKKRK